MSQELVDAIVGMRETEAVDLARQLLDQDVDPLSILDRCREAMAIVGAKFEQGEFFIPELILAGEILSQISELVKPRLVEQDTNKQPLGKIVLGTVEGDIHDLAKDIVAFMLDINGFEVHDLGVDVPPQQFIDKVKELDAPILGLSGFLTLALAPMKTTVDLLENEGLRNQVKVMIGGGPIDDQACAHIGADAWGRDAMEAVKIAQRWVKVQED